MHTSHRRPALLAALLAACALPVAAQKTGRGPVGIADTASIETSARREVHIAPDRATIVLSVETRGPAAAAASQANARTQRAVLDTLRAIGIAPSQISTAGYTVQPNYDPLPRGGMERNGFVARNAISVKLTQLDRVGAVIDAALARGATNVGQLSFDASNVADAQRAALADAATQAKAEAATLAKALGGTLGPLIMASMQSELPGPRPMAYAMARAGAAAETPIEEGDIVVSAYVVTRWGFVPSPPTP